MLPAMSKDAKTPARPSSNAKPRRRARRIPLRRWRLGLDAGLDYARALSEWAGLADPDAFCDRSQGAGPKARAVRRLGGRICGPRADAAADADASAARKRRRSRRRRRDAVLAQEARRRGVFRVKARDFRFPGAADD
jgi:hypothetical protein